MKYKYCNKTKRNPFLSCREKNVILVNLITGSPLCVSIRNNTLIEINNGIQHCQELVLEGIYVYMYVRRYVCVFIYAS